MHGRRQFVIWIVPLSGVTNATLVACYICQARLPQILFSRTKSSLKVESVKSKVDAFVFYFLLSTLDFLLDFIYASE